MLYLKILFFIDLDVKKIFASREKKFLTNHKTYGIIEGDLREESLKSESKEDK